MDALVIGPSNGLSDAVARGLRRRGLEVLRATPDDAADPRRTAWLLDEAGYPDLILALDAEPYAVVRALLPLSRAEIVLVVEQRVATAHPGLARGRSQALRALRREARDRMRLLSIVAFGRAGRRWVHLGGRAGALSAERAAAVVLRPTSVSRAACWGAPGGSSGAA